MCEFVCVRPTLLYPPRASKLCNTGKVEDLFFHCGWKSFIKDRLGIGDHKQQKFNINIHLWMPYSHSHIYDPIHDDSPPEWLQRVGWIYP